MTGVTIAESDVMINVTNSVTLNGTIVGGNELAINAQSDATNQGIIMATPSL